MTKPTKRPAGRETIAGLKRLLADVNGEWSADMAALKTRDQAEYDELRNSLQKRLDDSLETSARLSAEAIRANDAARRAESVSTELRKEANGLRDKLMETTLALATLNGRLSVLEPPEPPRMIEAPSSPPRSRLPSGRIYADNDHKWWQK